MMKMKLLFFGLFFCQGILAQPSSDHIRILEWAEYYFINQDFERALSHYSKVGDSIPLQSRRNFSRVYAQMGQLGEAAQTLRPLVDSDSAEVKDYYYFASYLTDNDKLRDEYRRKAIRLPIETYPQSPNESLASFYELIPLALNTEGSEFGAHLININDEDQLVYSQKQSEDYTKGLSKKILSDSPIYNLYQAEWDPKKLQAQSSEAFPLGLNSVFQDGPSSWDPDEQLLYLTRSAQSVLKQKTIQLDIYSWTFGAIQKQIARPLPFNSDGYATIHPAVSSQNRSLYFASDRPGGFGGMDLYYVDILGNGNYSAPVNLGPDINTAADEIFPFVHRENYLFYSRKTDNGSLSPKLAINTVDVRWHVMDLPAPFESDRDDFSFSLDPQLEYGLFSSNRDTGKGEDDLYAFKFTPKIMGMEDQYSYNPIDTLIVSQEGILKNDKALMMGYDPLTALFPKEAVLVDNVHHGALKLNSNGSFLYKNTSPLQVKDSFSYTVNSKYGKSPVIKVLLQRAKVALEKLPQAIQKTFLPIFYEFDKSNLLIDYKDRVDAVVAAMKAQPQMIVEVSSYTDCRGSKDYNLKLSQQRNQTIIDYVSERIGNKERIFGKGYGENTLAGNSTLDFLIISGSYGDINNAVHQQKDFEVLGYPAEVKKTKENLYQVIVDQAKTYAAAQEILNALSENGYQAWINQCDCCKLTEEEHLQNRITDFKIIRL
jgi:outer membrane protein OmpA-like peptidoglycan-associated protein